MSGFDATDMQLLDLLQEDDRQSLAVLSEKLGVPASTLNDRIRRLVKQGAVTGFHAHCSAEELGLDLLAFVFVGWTDSAVEEPFLMRVAQERSIQECHHVTGAWNYLLKVRLKNTKDLERFLGDVIKKVTGVQRTETIIVLSSAKETFALDTTGLPDA
ncbi:MAG: Lrp/AsnC family transcriptional regulator [Oricola sp.]